MSVSQKFSNENHNPICYEFNPAMRSCLPCGCWSLASILLFFVLALRLSHFGVSAASWSVFLRGSLNDRPSSNTGSLVDPFFFLFSLVSPPMWLHGLLPQTNVLKKKSYMHAFIPSFQRFAYILSLFLGTLARGVMEPELTGLNLQYFLSSRNYNIIPSDLSVPSWV